MYNVLYLNYINYIVDLHWKSIALPVTKNILKKHVFFYEADAKVHGNLINKGKQHTNIYT